MIARFLSNPGCCFAITVAVAQAEITVSEPEYFRGMCDASACVYLTDELFGVGDDEDGRVRVFKTNEPSPPTQVINLGKWLLPDPKSPESDLEAAARVGDRIYWITSHARNQAGKKRESRRRFLVTDLRIANGRVQPRLRVNSSLEALIVAARRW